MKKFVAVDSDGGDAKIIFAKDEAEARQKMANWLYEEEICDSQEDAISLITDTFDFHLISSEIK